MEKKENHGLERYHFIGIGGIGMSGLANLLLQHGCSISGSDLAHNYNTESLHQQGAEIYIGHSEHHIKPGFNIVYSTDIQRDNPELLAAKKNNYPLFHRSEILQKIMGNYHSIAVAGTHGKTTTSSLLTWVLNQSRQSPSYAIGGIIPQLCSNAKLGSGMHFIAEACESDASFLNYTPHAAIVTNIDCDHMDYYCSETALIDSFEKFMKQVQNKKLLLWCKDDLKLSAIAKEGISYGFGQGADLQGQNFRQEGWRVIFDVEFQGNYYPNVEVSLIGKHNALNALAVFGMSLLIGTPELEIRAALQTFNGVMRRCEKKGEAYNRLFLDDYAHHPTEIKATLQAVRKAIGERRMVVVYQPHRYSRAKACFGLYSNVFRDADILIVNEIYAAREKPIEGVNHEKIIEEIKETFKKPCTFVPRVELKKYLSNFLSPLDVLVTLGAGDVTRVGEEVLSSYSETPPKKLKVGVIFGGMSVEHEISLLSAHTILKFLNKDSYEIAEFGITPEGNWISGEGSRELLSKATCPFDTQKSKISTAILEELLSCDILFPILHGTQGEDGGIQGLFKMIDKPFVGCDLRSSSICMDKAITKILAMQEGVLTSPFISLSKYEWESFPDKILDRIDHELKLPLFVKPVHLGSSIGVRKVIHKEDLASAINHSFRYDTKLILENQICGREIEFAVLGNDLVTVFPPGEILCESGFYDFKSKYGPNSARTETCAQMSLALIETGKLIAEKCYRAAGCQGLARVDMFLDEQGKFWLNEINPIPGFTEISLYPSVCQAHGVPLVTLMDRLIALGLERHRKEQLLELKHLEGSYEA